MTFAFEHSSNPGREDWDFPVVKPWWVNALPVQHLTKFTTFMDHGPQFLQLSARGLPATCKTWNWNSKTKSFQKSLWSSSGPWPRSVGESFHTLRAVFDELLRCVGIPTPRTAECCDVSPYFLYKEIWCSTVTHHCPAFLLCHTTQSYKSPFTALSSMQQFDHSQDLITGLRSWRS